MKLKLLLGALGLVVVIIAIVFFSSSRSSQQDSNSTVDPSQNSNLENPDPESSKTDRLPTSAAGADYNTLVYWLNGPWNTYTNNELGISFDYPDGWGEVNAEEVTYESNFPSENLGSSWNFNFSNEIVPIDIFSRSINYVPLIEPRFQTYNKVAIDSSWGIKEIENKMGLWDGSLLFSSQVNNKSVFIVELSSYECIGLVEPKIITPFTGGAYPNLEIKFNTDFDVPLPDDFCENDEAYIRGLDIYKDVATKIGEKAHSLESTASIEIAERIAKSFKISQ